MHFMKFLIQSCSAAEFIAHWAQFYKAGKYPEQVYNDNLNLGGFLTEQNIEKLLQWKRGQRLPAKFNSIVEKAKQSVPHLNHFRALEVVEQRDFTELYEHHLRDLTKDKKKIVLKIFLVHVSRPMEYPMVDKNVLRAYHFLEHGEVVDPFQTPEIYQTYRKFFNGLVQDSGKSPRDVDKALMSFGQFLNSQFYTP